MNTIGISPVQPEEAPPSNDTERVAKIPRSDADTFSPSSDGSERAAKRRRPDTDVIYSHNGIYENTTAPGNSRNVSSNEREPLFVV
jgi:hypothetical protein